jgi:AcrR family transcriptional regulator
MSVASQPVGRRERNKQAKLERIMTAASELFAEYGVDEVTTQQIADKADIGTGTLFLYAKTKGELLLLVQNAQYAAALERGRAAAGAIPDVLDAVLSIVQPIVECNLPDRERSNLSARDGFRRPRGAPSRRSARHCRADRGGHHGCAAPRQAGRRR